MKLHLRLESSNSISKYTWKSQNSPQIRSYTYTYDRSNKLQNAQYIGVGTENYSVSTDYDVNGNLQHLQRYSKTGTNTYGLVDNLTYSYIGTGNKLQKVDDAVTGNAFANDFRDVAGNDYTYSVDGKMTKDGNKGISLIQYNYLDLVKNIKFSNNDSVSYWYSSTGSRIQRKVTKAGQPDSYTIYDGEMVYTFIGASPNLAGFGISEIQNGEGRYVNGKLEYGYTDHVGNLRLSYKDSLGVAFITQSQSYDPWSNVNTGSEYQLAGIQGDKYLVCGKEGDNLSGNILLDWRDYDSVTGRMNSYDPEDQSMSISGFAYCGNNPVMQVDPDGRFAFVPFLIGATIGGLSGYSLGKSNGASGWVMAGYILGGAAIGGISGNIGNAVAKSGMAYSNTLGIIAGSSVNSAGMSFLSNGKLDFTTYFGGFSFNWSKGNFGFLGKSGNSLVENIGYALGLSGNIQDVLAGSNPSQAKLQTENEDSGIHHADGSYERGDKDIIGHSQVTDKDGHSLIDYGPKEHETARMIIPVDGRNDYTRYSHSVEQVKDIRDNIFNTAIDIKGVNIERLKRISSRLNENPGSYTFGLKSCSSMCSRGLARSGVFLFGGIHPYTLRLSLILRNAGLRPAIYSHFLTEK
jgi:RHS repeat-associated protein